MPIISVIIPAHNHAQYLPETISSVLAQTFTDFELIIVDNGSTDNTKEVVATFNDPRIVYFYQEDSGLPANSRNVGIEMSSAEWVAFLDSDDVWLPQKLEMQMRLMEANKGAQFCCTNAKYFTAKAVDRTETELNELGFSGDLHDNTYVFDDIFRGNKVICSSVVVKKQLLERNGNFNEDPELRTVEDYDLWLKLARSAPLSYLGEPLVRYRIHPQNLSSDPISSYEKTLVIFHIWEKESSAEARRDRLSRIYFGMGRIYLTNDDANYKTYFKKSAKTNIKDIKKAGIYALSKLPQPIFKVLFAKLYRRHRGEKFISP